MPIRLILADWPAGRDIRETPLIALFAGSIRTASSFSGMAVSARAYEEKGNSHKAAKIIIDNRFIQIIPMWISTGPHIIHKFRFLLCFQPVLKNLQEKDHKQLTNDIPPTRQLAPVADVRVNTHLLA
jgi:hypothetical protein